MVRGLTSIGRAAVSAWIAIGLVFTSAAPAADVVFSTLSGPTVSAAQLSGNAVGTWNNGAQQFNTGFNNEVTNVTLGLQRIGTGGTFSIELWTNSLVAGTATPGSLVATIATASTSILSTSESAQSFPTSVAGLTKFSDYWIVFNALNVGPGTAYWAYTNTSTGPGVADTNYLAVNDGPGWSEAYGNYRGVMEVEAVPEPGTISLAVAAAGGVACGSAWRRRRHVSASSRVR